MRVVNWRRNFKRVIAVMISLMLIASIPFFALAKTWEDGEFSIEIPDDFYVLSAETPSDDPAWDITNVDPIETISDYKNMGALANFVNEGGSVNILLTSRVSDESLDIYNLKTATQEQKDSLLDSITYSDSEEIKAHAEYVDDIDQPFFKLVISGVMQGTNVNEVLFGTIFNGKAIAFDSFSTGDISEETMNIMSDMASSFKAIDIIPKEESEMLKAPEISPVTWVILGGSLLLIIGTFLFTILKNNKQKKQKSEMADKISRFRDEYEGFSPNVEDVLFVNQTDCNNTVVHEFSMYQAYKKNLVPLVAGSLIALLMLFVAIYIKTSWWMIVVVLALIAYYVYKMFTAGSKTEKAQRAAFSRGVTRVASFYFYEDVFRVGGIQTPNLYPYFQITDIRREKDYVYLYYAPENAYIVDLNSFEKGDRNDFNRFIDNKIKGAK